ncbi:RodZ domain-containing protein [Stenomitos frigidus]|uniref:RodZ domain-containing protein n=1 Tax=Stenomitos frigidus TaxID=1886765 RepID=UPI0015E685EB|nr:RodZ domain-containing protein [Stenomitos frigidus]
MKELDATQVEQLKTIGAYLGRERQERGVSLDTIAVKTYIPLRLLQALEEGQVERLPEPVFVQGFIRRFADAIGLDGMTLSKTFAPQESFMVERQAKGLDHSHPVAQPSVEQPSQTEMAPVEPIDLPPQFIQHDRPPRAERSFLPWILLGTAAALIVGVGLASLLNRPKPAIEAQPSETTASPVAPPPGVSTAPNAPSPQASSNPSPIASTEAPAAANSPIQVAVNLTDESWFQVITDGKTAFEGILKKGEQKTWTAQKKLVLQAGNAGAVSVSYNQGESKRLGDPGEVKDVTFPPPSDKPKPASAN